MGTLKAKVNGIWTPVAGNPQSTADLARWNSSWGLVGSTTSSDQDNNSATQSVIRTLTLTLTAGRQYRMVALTSNTYIAGGAVAGDTYGMFGWVDGVQTLAWYYSCDYAGNYTAPGVLSGFFTVSTTGSHTIELKGSRVSGTGIMRARFTLHIEDAGPTSQVAIAPPGSSPRVVASGNALGVIAVGSFPSPLAPMTVPASTETLITNPLPFYATVGRRYRINFQVRATAYSSAAGTSSFFLRDNGNSYRGWQPGGDPYLWNAGSYSAANFQWYMEGDNLNHSLEVVCSGIAMSLYRDYGIFNIEDVGPNSYPALPIPETPPLWTQVTAFANSWVNYANGRPLTSYRKIGDEVDVRVAVKNGTNGATVFTLPVGFRPPYTMDFQGRDGTTSPAACLFNITPAGDVIIYSSGGAGFAGICAFNASFSTTA